MKGQKGRYNIVYGYVDEQVGLEAGRLAVRLVNHLVEADPDATALAYFRRAADVVRERLAYRVGATTVNSSVAEVLAGGRGTGAAPAVLTCGTGEENIHNNRLLAAALGDPLHEVADLHNYTAWRDALHPHLTGLLEELW